MQEFIGFLKEYKELLIGVVCSVLTLICLLIKRKPKTIDELLLILDEVLLTIPTLINKAEIPGNGLAKKKEVRNSALSDIEKRIGRSLSESELSYCFVAIDKCIEAVLSTPQKKAL